MHGGTEPNPHPSLLPVSEGEGASLARQRLVNRFGIKAAEAFVTDDKDWQRAPRVAHSFLPGLGVVCHVLFGKLNAFLRQILHRLMARPSTDVAIHRDWLVLHF